MAQNAGQPNAGRKRQKSHMRVPVLHWTQGQLYDLHLCRGHEEAVDAIEVARVEEADLDLASAAVSRLKNLDLCTQHLSLIHI